MNASMQSQLSDGRITNIGLSLAGNKVCFLRMNCMLAFTEYCKEEHEILSFEF